ncbi:MAG: hypothetical protein HZC37_00020 [Burkholderiales bacterium]|nr:hypothetical protein [Burkholderiales bacterium]
MITASVTETAEGWRALLIAISFVNVLAWASAAAWLLLRKRAGGAPPGMFSLRRTLLLLSAGYVFGCAWRSWWPVYDIPRVVMVDAWMSSVVVGRSVATVAELCFVAQCALLLRAAGASIDSRFARLAAALLLPMAGVAETCSWYSVLSTSNLGHVFEEALWGGGAALWTAAMLALWPRSAPRARALLALCATVGTVYVGYMFAFDVPMYWARWLADEAAGRPYLALGQGLADVAGRWTVSTSWQHWRSEVAWMTLYFSVAVWLSIGLVHLPLPARAGPQRADPNRRGG